jgi:hypothetical protein
MSPELITAIKERIAAGQEKGVIKKDVLAMGYVEEVYEAAYTLAEHDIKTSEVKELPKVVALFMGGWRFVLQRPDLLALMLVPLFLESAAAFWFGYNSETDTFPSWPLFGIFTIIGIVYLSTLMTALFAVTRQDGEDSSLRAAGTWLKSHLLPLFFIFIISGLVIFGGFILFIIPGIIVAVLLTFAQYVYVREGKGGMAALLGSRAVVRGRWTTVAGKMLGFILLTLIPIVILELLISVLEGMMGEGKVIQIVDELLNQILAAIVAMINLYVMYHLYEALRITALGEAEPTRFAKIRYWGMAVVTVVTVGGIALGLLFFADKFTWLEEEVAAPMIESEPMSGGAMPSGFSTFKTAASTYMNEHGGSVLGVCEVLRPIVEGEGEVTCNDSETAWALEVVTGPEERVCADNSTPGKKIAVPLETKTECISI